MIGGGAGVAPSTITTGTGVVTALGVNTGSTGAFVVNGGALGTPSSGTVTNLTGTASININGTVGATTASTGAFTTLSASSTVSGTGFSNYLASPPAIGGTAPSTGNFTTLTSTLNVINGATSGAITLAVPAVSGSNTATFPAATGTVMVSGNMPAFSVYLTSNQTGISNTTFTKVALNGKYFDTNSNFDNTTNYRFTPTIAGYYQFSWGVDTGGTNASTLVTRVYKNGTSGTPMYGGGIISGLTLSEFYSSGAGIFYMNGTTDFVELWCYLSSSSGNTVYNNSYLSGSLVRTA
jgi:hypothetical protein